MELEKMRQQIDQIDIQIIELLKKRFHIVRKIGEFKKKHGLPIISEVRENKLVANNETDAFIKKIFNEIVKRSRIIQEKI